MSRSPRAETRTREQDAPVVAQVRKARVPLGVPRTRLTLPDRPGYKRRWINDDGKGRLQAALEGGYTFIEDPNLMAGQDGGGDKTDSRVSRIVGRAEGGKPLRAFAMEIPSEQYKADQASKQSALDEVDRAIRKGRLVPQGEEHRYVPDGGKAIRMKNETLRTAAPDPDEDPNAE